MASLGPSIWAVSDGRAGNAAQVRAVTAALGATSRWMRIAHIAGAAHRQEPLVLTPRAPWRWLPADRWPAPLQALPKAQRASLVAPWPTVWIAAGIHLSAKSIAQVGKVAQEPGLSTLKMGGEKVRFFGLGHFDLWMMAQALPSPGRA